LKVYKFRGSEQIDFVFDILFNKQLFCAEWSSLNDPMEGVFAFNSAGHDDGYVDRVLGKIQDAKRPLRVCSLSKTFNNHLLWAHYANGFTGVAIEFDIDPTEFEIVDIEYRGVFAYVDIEGNPNSNMVAREVLSSKYDAWSYEQEIRILSNNAFYTLKNPITRLIVGHRMREPLKKALAIICERLEIEIAQTGIGDEGIDADRFRS